MVAVDVAIAHRARDVAEWLMVGASGWSGLAPAPINGARCQPAGTLLPDVCDGRWLTVDGARVVADAGRADAARAGLSRRVIPPVRYFVGCGTARRTCLGAVDVGKVDEEIRRFYLHGSRILHLRCENGTGVASPRPAANLVACGFHFLTFGSLVAPYFLLPVGPSEWTYSDCIPLKS